MARFAVERLIVLVQARPIIWDKRTDDYLDRARKEVAWQDITAELYGDEWEQGNTNKRHDLVKYVKTRWASCRDQFRREVVEKGKSGSGQMTKRPYLYTQHLMFLKDVISVGETSDNLREDEAAPQPTASTSQAAAAEGSAGSTDPLESDVDIVLPTVPVAPPTITPPAPPRLPRRRRQQHLQEHHHSLLEEEVLQQLRERRMETPSQSFCRLLAQRFAAIPPHKQYWCQTALMSVMDVFEHDYDYYQMYENIHYHRWHCFGYVNHGHPPPPPPQPTYSAYAHMPPPPPPPHPHPPAYRPEHGHHVQALPSASLGRDPREISGPSASGSSYHGPFSRELFDM